GALLRRDDEWLVLKFVGFALARRIPGINRVRPSGIPVALLEQAVHIEIRPLTVGQAHQVDPLFGLPERLVLETSETGLVITSDTFVLAAGNGKIEDVEADPSATMFLGAGRCDLHLIAVVHPECPLLLGVRPGILSFAQPVYVPVGGRRSVGLIVLRCREMRAILDVRQIRVRAGVGPVPGIRSRPHQGLDRQLAGGADAKSRIVAHIVANLDLAVDAVELKINRAGLRSSARTHTHDKDRGPESRGAHDRSVAAHCVCPPLNLSAVFVRLSCSGTTGTAKALERPLRHHSSKESRLLIEPSCPTGRPELSEFAKISAPPLPPASACRVA